MKIALISREFQRNNGQGRVNYEIARGALERGHFVTILAIQCADDLSSHPHCHFVPLGQTSLPTDLLQLLAFARDTAKWLRKHRSEVDLVQGNGFVTWEPCDVSAAHFIHAAFARSPWYSYRGFSFYSLYQQLWTKLNIRWEKKAFAKAKRVIAVARPIVNELKDIGIPESKITMIWNGVDIHEFYPGPGDRRHFGLPEGVPLALFVGDIKTSRKNLETVYRAMQLVPDLHLAVAGSTNGSPYPAMAKEMALEHRVHFLGQVTEIPLMMRSADVFTFPSRYEAQPLVLLEAMASGLPSIVSPTFGADEFLREGGVILSNPEDYRGLATALQQLGSDLKLRNQMSIAGRDLAVKMQWSVTVEKYLRVFEEVSSTGG
jgi:glycosyltransferase involved in cell wall biosynthesis